MSLVFTSQGPGSARLSEGDVKVFWSSFVVDSVSEMEWKTMGDSNLLIRFISLQFSEKNGGNASPQPR